MSTATEPVRRPGPVILGAVLLTAGIALLWTAIRASGGDLGLAGPRLAPVLVTAAWVVVAAAYLVIQLRPATEQPEPIRVSTPAGVAACLAGFAVALEYAGFVVSAAVFVVAVARVLGSRHLVRDLVVAVVLPLAVYLCFTRLLDIFLPAGVLPL
ncbi:tripartite tricarboxylate transporter TctB family protein [Jidongwangia harbinensis]|uniref:tripartite tricarboxylate transporter TctB family protein n=1 Tax=Jidongwangia harbinensis TaxID=2878561 RepID=UPI001CDA26E1|nr:tripartite tricarboxylate transporter TctB family protein [Jidongwangia harbinensis]MCA2211850.1 tripartite tricarboxylate transporter TctB family protein [Jidongwangia harbinensis]